MKACPAAMGKEVVRAGRGGEGRALTGVGLEVDHPVGDGGEEHSLREQVGHLHQHLRRRKGHLRIVARRALPVCTRTWYMSLTVTGPTSIYDPRMTLLSLRGRLLPPWQQICAHRYKPRPIESTLPLQEHLWTSTLPAAVQASFMIAASAACDPAAWVYILLSRNPVTQQGRLVRQSGRKSSQKMVRSMSTTGCTVEALLVPCAQHRHRQRLDNPCRTSAGPSVCSPGRGAHGLCISLVQVH